MHSEHIASLALNYLVSLQWRNVAGLGSLTPDNTCAWHLMAENIARTAVRSYSTITWQLSEAATFCRSHEINARVQRRLQPHTYAAGLPFVPESA